MSHDVIGTAVMVMATVIITAALLNAIFPSILTGSNDIRSTGSAADDRVTTSLAFVNYDVLSGNQVDFDVLNNGRTSVPGTLIENMTVYLGAENAPLLIISGRANGTEVYWDYELTGSNDRWDQGETLVIRVHDPAAGFADGNYRIRIQLPSGAMSEHAFKVEV